MKIYTDACWKDGISSHNYQVFKGRKRIKRRTFLSELNTTPYEAEAMTIIEALIFYNKRGVENIDIYTDCKFLVEDVNGICNPNRNDDLKNSEDVRYIKHLLKITNSRLHWLCRESSKISKVDHECRKMMTTKMGRILN